MLFSELQKAFDRDWAEERISYDGWQKNASNDGVMAYKLLAQTGEKETINRSIVCFEKLNCSEMLHCLQLFYGLCRLVTKTYLVQIESSAAAG